MKTLRRVATRLANPVDVMIEREGCGPSFHLLHQFVPESGHVKGVQRVPAVAQWEET